MKAKHGQRGQALVEFSLTATVFMILFFGVIDAGRLLTAYDQVAYAARIGARWAIVNTPQPSSNCSTAGSSCQTAIVNYILGKTSLDTSKLTTTITFGGTPYTSSSYACATQPTPGCWINIKLQYAFGFAFPIPGRTLSSSSQMVISTQY